MSTTLQGQEGGEGGGEATDTTVDNETPVTPPPDAAVSLHKTSKVPLNFNS